MELQIFVTLSTVVVVLLAALVAGNAITRARRWKKRSQSSSGRATGTAEDKK